MRRREFLVAGSSAAALISFGRQVAEQTAFYMEYQSKGWIV